MNLNLQDLYDYVFTEKSNPNAGILDNLSHEIKQNQIARKIKNTKEIFASEAKNPLFRSALRAFNATHLETILFGNVTDEVIELPAIPDEKEIHQQFLLFEEKHHFFDNQDKEMVLKKFNALFKICKIIADSVEQTNNPTNMPAFEQAYAMLVLFGEENNSKKYFSSIDQYIKSHNMVGKQYALFNTLRQELPRNTPPKYLHLEKWRKLIQTKGSEALSIFKRANEIEARLSGAPHDYGQALDVLLHIEFKNADKYPELAKLCKEHNISESDFDHASEIEAARIKPKTETESKNLDLLPNIMVNGDEVIEDEDKVSCSGYYLVKLPKDDLRAYVLGEITNCCQSIGGNSEACVIDGVTRPNNGFLVLVKMKKKPEIKFSNPPTDEEIKSLLKEGKIRGQGYIWRTHWNNLTVDSWENLDPGENSIAVKMLTEYSKKVVHNKDSSCLRVTIGTGGKTPKDLFKEDALIADTMLEGNNYGDANSQKIIYLHESKQNELYDTIIKTLALDLEKNHPLETQQEIIQQFSKNFIISESQAIAMCNLFKNQNMIDYLSNKDNAKKLCGSPHRLNILIQYNEASLLTKKIVEVATLDSDDHEKIILILSKAKLLANFEPTSLQDASKTRKALDILHANSMLDNESFSMLRNIPADNLHYFAKSLILLKEHNLDSKQNKDIVYNNFATNKNINIASEIVSEESNFKKYQLSKVICQLASKGKVELIEKLIKKYNIDINYLIYQSGTPLTNAVHNNQLEVVKFLLEHKANINSPDKDNQTPFMYAIKNENVEMIKFLLEYKDQAVDVNASSEPPLVWAFRNIDDEKTRKEIVTLLLKDPQTDIHKKSKKDKLTPLMLAVWRGDNDFAELLIDRKADTNAVTTDEQQNTALKYALVDKNNKILERLLSEKNTNPNIKFSERYESLLDYALDYENKKAIQLLMAHPKINFNTDTLFRICPLSELFTYDELFNLLKPIKNNFFNNINSDGNTMLHLAVQNNNIHLLKILINEKKIDPTTCKKDGQNALDLALLSTKWDKANYEIIKVLVEHGVKPTTNKSIYHFHKAVANNDFDYVKAYLDQYPDQINEKSLNNQTALHFVKDIKMADLLLEKKSDLTMIDSDGSTPLLNLFDLEKNDVPNKLEIIEKLLEAKADINHVDVEGFSPILIATREKDDEGNIDESLIELLLKYPNLNINAQTKLEEEERKIGQATALHFAIFNDCSINLATKLIDHKINIDTPNQAGETPLIDAKKNPELFQLLLDKKANLMTAFELAPVGKKPLLVFKDIIDKSKYNELFTQIKKLQQYDCAPYKFEFENPRSNLIYPVRYYNCLKQLETALHSAMEKFAAASTGNPLTLFAVKWPDPRTMDLFSKIYSILQDINKDCLIPFKLPEGPEKNVQEIKPSRTFP